METVCAVIMAAIAVIGFLAAVIKYVVVDPSNRSNQELRDTIEDLQELIKDFRREFTANLEKTNSQVANHEVRISVLEDHEHK